MARMTQGLNQLSEQEVRQLLADYEARLARGKEAATADPSIQSHPEFLMDEAIIRRMMVHCLHALQERQEAVGMLLCVAVDSYVAMFRLRNPWREAELRAEGKPVDLSLVSVERMFAAVVDSLILQREDALQSIASMDPAAYSNVYPPQLGVYHAAISALLAYATGDAATARRRAMRIVDHAAGMCPATVADRLRPFMGGLIALCDAQPQAFDAALERLLSTHRRHATEGSGARHPATLLCAEATALTAMARRAGMSTQMDSPYIAHELIA